MFFYYHVQIEFVGYSPLLNGPFIAIDDVSFTKETCEHIPWEPDAGEERDVYFAVHSVSIVCLFTHS